MKVTPIATPLQSMIMSEIVQKYYADYIKVDQVMLFELVTAANFMDIKPLLDLTCLAVSFFIKVSFNLLDFLRIHYDGLKSTQNTTIISGQIT